jgi:hypothetical protein
MISRRTLWVFCLISVLGVNCATAAAAAQPGDIETSREWVEDSSVQASVPVVADPPWTILDVPPDVPVRRHYYSARTGEMRDGGVAEIGGQIVYSNTGALLPMGVQENWWIADDITVAAQGGCTVSGYEIMVHGGGDGTGPGFTVDFVFYDACPSDGGQMVPGTGSSMTFADDGPHLVTVDMEGVEVPMPDSFWIGVKFDRAHAAWLAGAAAEFGFTADRYYHQSTGCDAHFAPDIYAGFYAQVYCIGDFATEFVAYYNPETNAMFRWAGADVYMVDDITLPIDNCELTKMTVGLRGNSGPYTAEIELWRGCWGPEHVIGGTQGTFQGVGDGSAEIATFLFDEPIYLGTDSFWLAIRPDRDSVGPIMAGEPSIGESDDLFAIFSLDDPVCYYFIDNVLDGYPYGAFNFSVRCAGAPPAGACCDMTILGQPASCRDVPFGGCQSSLARWSQYGLCDDPGAFDPPCGTSACCQEGEYCSDETEDDCDALEGHWQRAQFCGEGNQECLWYACYGAEGDCQMEHPTPGCNRGGCCDLVCDIDSFCCLWWWDSNCVYYADTYCSMPAVNETCVTALLMDSNDEAETDNTFSETDPEEPGFCCHPYGPGMIGIGSVWFKFVATDSSARIDTCCTPGQSGEKGENSIIEVYSVGDNSSPQAACASLTPLICNDDNDNSVGGFCGCTDCDCLPGQHNSGLDVFNLTPGHTYYVQLASITGATRGKYNMRIRSPSPASTPPGNNTCANASGSVPGTMPFNLENATMDCPSEVCLPGMENDVWFIYLAPSDELTTVETCEPGGGGPDTTLAVYHGLGCPVEPTSRVACNDDAGGDCGLGSRVTFSAAVGEFYKIRIGGQEGSEPSGTLTISINEDCQPNGIPDPEDIANCPVEDPDCQDCNDNDVPDFCDIRDGAALDCQPNGVPDDCDIANGTSQDNNGDGIPDECGGCADGAVTFVNPVTGFHDARQPHEVDDVTPQGVKTFQVTAPEGADADGGACWQWCETGHNPGMHSVLAENGIASVVDNGGGSYSITLDREIAPGEVTTLTYDNTAYGGSTVVTGVFTYLPSDADGDGTSAPADILAVINSLNGVVPLPDERVDMDRDGDPGPADILRAIDLLNGAGDYNAWLDVQINSAGCP